jgi:arylsulfatase
MIIIRNLRSIAFLIALAAFQPAIAAERPNIVIIMADDIGYSDLGCYGGEIRTPNIDRLAGRGLRFRRFYNNSICCPTRASLLTGLYPHQAGMGRMTTNLGTSGYSGELNDRCVTIAQVLQTAGYSTLMSGKWHVTQEDNRENWPRQRGFDRFYGTLGGSANFFTPRGLYRDNTNIDEEPLKDPDYYYTDAISGQAARFIREAEKGRPFFLYVAYTAPHWPLHAFERDIAGYDGVYEAGWDRLRQQRYERMLSTGVIDRSYRLSTRDETNPAWADEPHRSWQVRRMQVYAAQVSKVDEGVGRIVESLKATGRYENTLIFYLHDNGACHVEYAVDRKAASLSANTRDGRTVIPGNRPDVMPGGEDTFQSYGKQWANLGNTPFRLYKSYQHEGGIVTPLIAHWPGGIKPRGEWTDQVGHVMDFMPTCLELAGAEYPREWGGKPILPVEGLSLVPVLRGQERASHRALYWEYSNARAIRQGEWKLVAFRTPGWELYHLAADPTELDDLADRMPSRVSQLSAAWHAWADKTGVIKR